MMQMGDEFLFSFVSIGSCMFFGLLSLLTVYFNR